MVFQKKGEKVASNAHQSFNQSSNNMGVRIVWCKKGVRIVWVHPSYKRARWVETGFGLKQERFHGEFFVWKKTDWSVPMACAACHWSKSPRFLCTSQNMTFSPLWDRKLSKMLKIFFRTFPSLIRVFYIKIESFNKCTYIVQVKNCTNFRRPEVARAKSFHLASSFPRCPSSF